VADSSYSMILLYVPGVAFYSNLLNKPFFNYYYIKVTKRLGNFTMLNGLLLKLYLGID